MARIGPKRMSNIKDDTEKLNEDEENVEVAIALLASLPSDWTSNTLTDSDSNSVVGHINFVSKTQVSSL